jgi:hypothetical protein
MYQPPNLRLKLNQNPLVLKLKLLLLPKLNKEIDCLRKRQYSLDFGLLNKLCTLSTLDGKVTSFGLGFC